MLRRVRRRRRRRPDRARRATCGSSSARTAPARPRSSTPSPGWCRPPGRSGSAAHELLGQKVAPDRPAGRRPHVPDRQRVRGADRAAEPRHRRGRRARAATHAAPARRGVPEAVEAGAGDGRADRTRATCPPGVLAHGQKQWLEIGMLLVQDARLLLLDEPVAGMSQTEREETGAAAAADRRASARSSSSSTTWSSCARFAASVTVLHAGQGAQRGDGRARCRPTRRCSEVYLGPRRHREARSRHRSEEAS